MKAKSDADIFMLAGAAAFSSSSAGVGIASTVFVHTDVVKAQMLGVADVSSGGANGVTVNADSSEDLLTIAAAGAASASSAAVAGSVVVNVLSETTTASIGAGSTVQGQDAPGLKPDTGYGPKRDSAYPALSHQTISP